MAFTGQLRQNEIFGAIYNMIINMHVFSDNIKGTNSTLVDKMRTDGSMLGDTKLYYSTQCLESYPWMNDKEAQDLLKLHRPEAPDVQAISVDTFRQIAVSTDDYMSKRAFATEGAFSAFNSVMLGWLGTTKKVYESKLMNAYVGTTETDVGEQQQTITINEGDNFGLKVAEKLANILVALKDADYDFNDYGHLRSYDEGDLMVIWNSDIYNAIKKVDLPTVFNLSGILGEFEQHVLPAKYFGEVVGTAGTSTTNENNTTIRSLIEKNYEVANAGAHPRARLAEDGKYYVHVFSGDLLPDGVEFNQNEAYYQKDDIAFKVIHKKSVPYFGGFSAGTSFFNPRALVSTNYLTFGHNTLEYLKNYPFITTKIVEA